MDESRLIYPKCLTGDQASAGVATILSDLRRTEAIGFRPCTDGRTGGNAFPRTICRRRGKGESPLLPCTFCIIPMGPARIVALVVECFVVLWMLVFPTSRFKFVLLNKGGGINGASLSSTKDAACTVDPAVDADVDVLRDEAKGKLLFV